MNVYLIKNILIKRYKYKEADLFYYTLNSFSLRQITFYDNPMNVYISFQLYKTVFRSILFLTVQEQLYKVDIVIIFPM